MSEESRIVVLTLAEAERPAFVISRGKKFVQYGSDNLYPDYLLNLYNTAAKHGAIVSSKATYVKGKGWQPKAEDPKADQFIKSVNRYGESLYQVFGKAITDLEIFEGAYVQVIWNNSGTGIAEIYHTDFTRVRTNIDNTQFYYRESWGATWRTGYSTEEKVYPAFNPSNPKGSQILFMKAYSPGCGAYPIPDYMRGLDYIEAEIEVGKHTRGNAKTGFSASKSITLTDGQPSDDEQKKITKKFGNAFTGATGRKFILNFVQGAERKPIIEDLGASDLTKEDFSAVDNMVRDNIYAAHKITTPALFGVATPGSLGQRSELRDGYEIFKNTYVNDKQQFVEGHVNKLAKYAGVTTELEIIPTDPIGIDPATIASFAPKGWLLEQYGIDASKYPETQSLVPGANDEQLEADTNPLLRNLTGRQWQGIERIKRKMLSGSITDAAARMVLASAYGLTDEQISVLLGTSQPGDETFSDQEDDRVIQIFSEYGQTGEGLIILKSKRVKYADESEAEQREYEYLKFVQSQMSDFEVEILTAISKDKLITPEALSEALDIPLKEINSVWESLSKSGAIKTEGDETTLTKPLRDLTGRTQVKSFKVMYSYSGPQDSRNRPFCAKMMQLGRFYSRADIEKISERLGYSVWDRRGGFYHNPNTDETTPYCRHTWMSHVVMTTR